MNGTQLVPSMTKKMEGKEIVDKYFLFIVLWIHYIFICFPCSRRAGTKIIRAWVTALFFVRSILASSGCVVASLLPYSGQLVLQNVRDIFRFLRHSNRKRTTSTFCIDSTKHFQWRIDFHETDDSRKLKIPEDVGNHRHLRRSGPSECFCVAAEYCCQAVDR